MRKAGESHPSAEDELSLYGCSDLDEQIGWLINTTKSPKVNFATSNDDSESEERDENDLIKDIVTILVQWKNRSTSRKKFGWHNK